MQHKAEITNCFIKYIVYLLLFLANIEEVLCQLRESGLVRVLQDSNNVYTHICFARFQQITWFRKFHDVVNVDATHGTNREGYVWKLISIAQVQIVSIFSHWRYGIRAPSDVRVRDKWKICVPSDHVSVVPRYDGYSVYRFNNGDGQICSTNASSPGCFWLRCALMLFPRSTSYIETCEYPYLARFMSFLIVNCCC